MGVVQSGELGDRRQGGRMHGFICVVAWVCGKSLSTVSFNLVHLTIQTCISRGERGAQEAFVWMCSGYVIAWSFECCRESSAEHRISHRISCLKHTVAFEQRLISNSKDEKL
jgi:hypothetical protein